MLVAEGVPTHRASQLLGRIQAIAKKQRRRKKLKPINRNRSAVKTARAEFAKRVRHLFDTERPKVAAQIVKLIQRTTKSDDDQIELIMGEIDLEGWVTLVIDGESILVHITVDGSGEAVTQIGGKLSPAMLEQVNEAAASWAHERAAELVGMRYEADGSLVVNPNAEWAITDSTRDLLREDIARAIEEGLSTDELADLLAEGYAFSADRADAIARTEIAMADIQGSLLAYAQSGMVEGKEVILGSEHGDPDECDDAADMGVVALEDDFGGLGDPPYHPNCECDVLPVLAEEGDEEVV
jgi:hypothetical protein